MGDYEPQLCSTEEVNGRSEVLKLILEEVAEVTGDMVNIKRLASAKNTVELGCGRGAYGRLIRRAGNTGILIGVDNVYPYEGETGYEAYTRIIGEDARSPTVMNQIKQIEPDLIIGIGLPPQINKFIIDNDDKLELPKKCMIILITDFEVSNTRDFMTFHGLSAIDDNIYVKQIT